MPFRRSAASSLRLLLLAGVAAALLAGCATSPMTTGSIGNAPAAAAPAEALPRLAAQYKKNPGDRTTTLYYAAALRTNGQPEQAVAVLEAAIARTPRDAQLRIDYAKALSAAGRFEQALNVVDSAIDPAAPDWNGLLVKGAILDQSGRNAEARAVYGQALKIAPEQASLHANLGLSYAMTSELDKAEAELRLAVRMRGANSQIRQNLALVIGLQGRFEESQKLFSAELPPEKVAANMAYIRAMLTQQNRWDLVKGTG